jgi:hypothetical protein
MIRKNLKSPEDLDLMPSLLGGLFRAALTGEDSYDYKSQAESSNQQKIETWNKCRAAFGMTSNPEDKGPYVDWDARQQYTALL